MFLELNSFLLPGHPVQVFLFYVPRRIRLIEGRPEMKCSAVVALQVRVGPCGAPEIATLLCIGLSCVRL